MNLVKSPLSFKACSGEVQDPEDGDGDDDCPDDDDWDGEGDSDDSGALCEDTGWLAGAGCTMTSPELTGLTGCEGRTGMEGWAGGACTTVPELGCDDPGG